MEVLDTRAQEFPVGDDLADKELDWLMFRSDGPGAVDGLVKKCCRLKTAFRFLLPEWLTETTSRFEWLMYPVYLDDEMCMGRNANAAHHLVNLWSNAGYVLGQVIEERFVVKANNKGGVDVTMSCLFDDETIIFVRHETNEFGERTTLYTRTAADDLRQVLQRFLHKLKSSCPMCAARSTECECRLGLTDRRSRSPRKLALSPEHFWDTLKDVMRMDHFVRPQGCTSSSVLQGPTPSRLFSPRLVSIEVCEMDAMTLPILELHMARLAQRRRLQPSLTLPESFVTTDNFIEAEHQRRVCSLCGLTFSRVFNLKRHVLSVHSSEQSFECKLCNRTFSLRQNLLSHIKDVHERRRSENCPDCGSLFSTRAKVRAHRRRVHQKERPHRCELCERSFFQKSDLERHLASVHRERTVRKGEEPDSGTSAPPELRAPRALVNSSLS